MPVGRKLSGAQRRKIARGKALDLRHAEIARQAGVSVSTVSHLVRQPDVRRLVDRLQAKHEDKLEELYTATLAGCARDIASPKVQTRFAARAEAMRLVTAAESLNAPGSSPHGLHGAGSSLSAPGADMAGSFNLADLLMVGQVALRARRGGDGGPASG